MAQLDLLSAISPMPPYSPLPEMTLPETTLSPDGRLPPKATGAYKTIREVSEELGVPQHVLRFWESHFPQVKPSRMRGSRRYYRPEDVDVLKTIQMLLYKKGYTIKGAKKVIRDGKQLVAAVSPKASTASSRPVASSTSAGASSSADKKNVDRKALVSELRVLKSMLTSLL